MTEDEAFEVLEILAGRRSGMVTQTQIRDAARIVLAGYSKQHPPTADALEALDRLADHALTSVGRVTADYGPGPGAEEGQRAAYDDLQTVRAALKRPVDRSDGDE